jgi:small-conductance mechanosensitive channel
MKKILCSSIIWFSIAFLVMVTSPWLVAGPTPSAIERTGIPVVFNGQSLFTIQNNFGTISPRGRQLRAERRIAEFAKHYSIPSDDLTLTSMDSEGIPVDVIVGGDGAIHFITEADARTEGITRQELSQRILESIRAAIERYRWERSAERITIGIGASVLATIALGIALRVIGSLFSIAYRRIRAWEETHIQAVRIAGIEIIGPDQLDDITAAVAKLVRIFLTIGLIFFYVAFVLSQFPWTRDLGGRAWEIFLEKLEQGGQLALSFLPNAITILMILTIAYFLGNLAKTFFWKLGDGSLSMPGFYPDWALPTYRLVSILLTVLTLMAIVPLLPWSQSPIFQGVGVVFGLLFSLGSSSVIANMISGCVLIYTRAFRQGDVVTIDQIEGQIIDKNLLVTRLLTSSNEVISIPNAKILNGSVKNLNFSSQELAKPLIVKTTVYLGYEVPSEQAYRTLVEAGTKVEGVSASYPPFVYQKELNNVFVTYILGVYLELEFIEGKTAKDFEKLYSNLNESVRESCLAAGIRIFAPVYYPDPTIYGHFGHNRLS